MLIKGLNHLAFITDDMTKTVRFYRNLLSMTLQAMMELLSERDITVAKFYMINSARRYARMPGWMHTPVRMID